MRRLQEKDFSRQKGQLSIKYMKVPLREEAADKRNLWKQQEKGNGSGYKKSTGRVM